MLARYFIFAGVVLGVGKVPGALRNAKERGPLLSVKEKTPGALLSAKGSEARISATEKASEVRGSANGKRQCVSEVKGLCYTVKETKDTYAITMERQEKKG